MPTYEYQCKSCGYNFDVVQSFSDEPLKVCEKCGGELRKVFGNIAITFKGSGFYKTDSRSSSSSTVAPSSSSGDAAASPSGDSSSSTSAPAPTPASSTPKTDTSSKSSSGSSSSDAA